MYGWRPLKFRIEAFVNGFIDLVSCLFWLAELIFFWLRLTDGCCFLGFASTNHILLLEPLPRSLPVNSGFPLPSLPHRRFLAILFHPIVHPIELVAGWIDGTAHCQFTTHYRRRGHSHPFNGSPSFGQPCTPPVVLIYLRTSPSSISGLWSMDMRFTCHHAPSRTSPHGSPVAPSASSPPINRSTNQPTNKQTMTAHSRRIPAGRHRQNPPLPQ